MLTPAELERRHTYHPPRPHTTDAERHQAIRDEVHALASWVDELLTEAGEDGTPAPREISCFHTALEEASFWAHAALARSRYGHHALGSGHDPHAAFSDLSRPQAPACLCGPGCTCGESDGEDAS